MGLHRCCRLHRTKVFASETNPLHPKLHRSISTTPSTSAESSTDATSAVPPTSSSIPRQNRDDEIRTTGSKGSPDYIPFKRGYAPHLPIPSRKFNLPHPKLPAWQRGIPVQKVPTERPRAIKNVGIEYERQLQAMRRGYIEWRQQQYREKLRRRKEAAERPHPPKEKEFEPGFAERMTTPSGSDTKQLEQLLFGQKVQQRVRGAGFQSAHHQKLLEKKKHELITNYLSLYAATPGMITTYDQLDTEINRAFADGYIAAYRVETPPSYDELVDEIEGGHAGSLRGGYMSRRNQDREQEVYNAMMGTVGEGRPGFEEVMKVIQEGVETEEGKEQKPEELIMGVKVETAEGETAVIPEVSSAGTGQERSTFAPTEIDRQVDDVVLPTGTAPPSIPDAEKYAVTPSAADSSNVLEPGTTTATATVSPLPTPTELEYEKELLRQSYRAGFTKPVRRYLPTTSAAFHPDSADDLSFPSDIKNAITHTPPQSRPSIADLAEDSSVPKFKSRKDILDTARQHAEELGVKNPFPELKSVDIREEGTLNYLAQREFFEREYPSRRARQPTNRAEWAKPTSMNKSFTSTTATTTTEEIPDTEIELESAPVEEVIEIADTNEAAASEKSSESAVEEKKSILDEIELDPSDRKALEEIRANRELKKGVAPKK